jgi:DNA polymerase-3 subunit beta
MRLTCDREKLLATLQVVTAVIPARSPKTVLLGAKLTAEAEGTFVSATDLEVGIRCRVPDVTCESRGEAVIPAARVLAILREMRDETVELSLDRDKVEIRGARSRFSLATEDPRDFPPVPGFDEQRFHRVQPELLRVMIRRTVFATDPENTRYALGGVLFELEGEVVRLVATDGRRLAVMQGTGEALGGHSTKELSPVVPAKALQILERLLVGEADPTLIAVQENRVLFATGKAVLSSRLLEGRFPQYQNVIPRRHAGRVVAAVGELLNATRQVEKVTSEEHRGVTWELGAEMLALAARAPEIGEGRVELAVTQDSPPMSVSFDPRFLVEMLRTLEESMTITVDFNDPESAAVFRTEDGYTYVLMPLAPEEGR